METQLESCSSGSPLEAKLEQEEKEIEELEQAEAEQHEWNEENTLPRVLPFTYLNNSATTLHYPTAATTFPTHNRCPPPHWHQLNGVAPAIFHEAEEKEQEYHR